MVRSPPLTGGRAAPTPSRRSPCWSRRRTRSTSGRRSPRSPPSSDSPVCCSPRTPLLDACRGAPRTGIPGEQEPRNGAPAGTEVAARRYPIVITDVSSGTSVCHSCNSAVQQRRRGYAVGTGRGVTVESPTVSAQIHDHMDTLTDAERRVARELLTDYPAAGLGTSHSLAKAAGVSAPTVVRFAASVGFDGFTDMQHHLRAEISQGGSSPVLRALAHGAAHRHHEPVAKCHAPPDGRDRGDPATDPELGDRRRATELIAHCPARVLVTGDFSPSRSPGSWRCSSRRCALRWCSSRSPCVAMRGSPSTPGSDPSSSSSTCAGTSGRRRDRRTGEGRRARRRPDHRPRDVASRIPRRRGVAG